MIALHVGGAYAGLVAQWAPDPTALIGVPLAAWLYTRGLRRGRRARLNLHPWWRPVLFYTALAVVLIALVSPLDHLANELFLFHMAQHLLIIVVAPPLVLLSAPMIPMLRGIPRPLRRRLLAPLAHRWQIRAALRYVTLPLVAWSIYVGIFLGWHAPPLYNAALANAGVHLVEHLAFSFGAFLFWWNVIDPIPLRPNLPYLARLPYIFVTTVPNFSLGAFLVFAMKPWYDHAARVPFPLGLSALEDQRIGGLIMWVPGALVLLTALLAVLAVMMVKEEQHQRLREAPAPRSPGLAGQGTDR